MFQTIQPPVAKAKLKTCFKQRLKKIGGFSLTEALIALVIFSVGLLGISQMQLWTIQHSQDTSYRGTANILASNMSARMLANRVGANANGYLATAANNTACLGSTNPFSCSANEMAAMDLFEWQQTIAAVLPEGAGVVCRDSTPDSGTPTAPDCDASTTDAPYVIKVWWRDRGQTDFERFALSIVP